MTRLDPISLLALTGTFDSYVIAAHAPHGDRPDMPVWWENLARTFQLLHAGIDILLCVDSNAHMGQHTFEAVGCEGAEAPNASTEHFHMFLLANGLVLPATQGKHRGQHATFNRGGHKSRIDFIAIGQKAAAISISFMDHN